MNMWRGLHIKLLSTTSILLLLFSCGKKKLSASDYMKYIEDENNGLKIKKQIGSIEYAALYKPLDYVLLKEHVNDNVIKQQEGDGLQYFSLHYSVKNSNADILKVNLASSQEYYERENYFSFGLQNDLCLVEGKDTLHCQLFNYVHSYGLSPAADFVLAFDKKKGEQEDETLVIDDKTFGGGIIKMKIDKNDIENIPELTGN